MGDREELIVSIDKRTRDIQKTLTDKLVPLVAAHEESLKHGQSRFDRHKTQLARLTDPETGAVMKKGCKELRGACPGSAASKARRFWRVVGLLAPLAAVILTVFLTVKYVVPAQVEASVAAMEKSQDSNGGHP